MIGGALVRFYPDQGGNRRQMGSGFTSAWKDVKTRAPTLLREVLNETAMEGLKGLNADGKGKNPNWKGGLQGLTRGATRSVKHKADQELKKLLTKKVRRDLFGR